MRKDSGEAEGDSALRIDVKVAGTGGNILPVLYRKKVREQMNRFEAEEMILTMADIVVENRQLRQEVKRLREVEKEIHDYIREQCRESEQAVKDIIRIPLENICRMNK